jgi:class 3 adenylate cyclase
LPGSRYQSLRALQPVMEADWETFTEVRAGLEFGWSAGELAHRYAAFLRECVTPQMASRIYGVAEGFDVTERLRDIRSPTLVLHRQQLYFWDVETARSLTAQIDGARLTVLEGVATAPFLGDVDALERTIDEFLASDSDAVAKSERVPGTAIILFADIADSTALTEQLGDTAFRAKARELDERLRALIHERAGTPIEGKLLGDGVLATFGSARDAIACAQACHTAASDAGLALHAGIHAGDVLREDGNIFGGAVNIAARVAAEASAGETLVSQTVRDLARTSAGVEFADAGEHAMKGVGEPLRLWAVRAPLD